MSIIAKSIKTEYISGCQGSGQKGPWAVTANEYGVSFCVDENILKLDSGDISMTC